MEKVRLEPLQLQASRQLAVALGLAHTAAGGLMLTLDISAGLITGAAVLLLLSAGTTISRYALLRHSRSVVRLELTDREQVRWQTRVGSWHTGLILGSSTVAPWLTVLNIRCDGQRWPIHVALMSDSLDPAAFRRLRVWLRWGPRVATGDAATP